MQHDSSLEQEQSLMTQHVLQRCRAPRHPLQDMDAVKADVAWVSSLSSVTTMVSAAQQRLLAAITAHHSRLNLKQQLSHGTN